MQALVEPQQQNEIINQQTCVPTVPPQSQMVHQNSTEQTVVKFNGGDTNEQDSSFSQSKVSETLEYGQKKSSKMTQDNKQQENTNTINSLSQIPQQSEQNLQNNNNTTTSIQKNDTQIQGVQQVQQQGNKDIQQQIPLIVPQQGNQELLFQPQIMNMGQQQLQNNNLDLLQQYSQQQQQTMFLNNQQQQFNQVFLSQPLQQQQITQDQQCFLQLQQQQAMQFQQTQFQQPQFCNQCQMAFPNIIFYNQHLKLFHNIDIAQNFLPQLPMMQGGFPQFQLAPNSSFFNDDSIKCHLCNLTFQKQEDYVNHQDTIHAKNIKKKAISKKGKKANSKKMVKAEEDDSQKEPVIKIEAFNQQFQQQQFQDLGSFPNQGGMGMGMQVLPGFNFLNNQNQQFNMLQGAEKIEMHYICPKKKGNYEEIKNNKKLWKSKYQNFNKLFMLKILNVFTAYNLSQMENLPESTKDMLINYAAKIKKTGKRQITLNKMKMTTNENNEEVKTMTVMKKVKIDYFQNAHYLLCFLQINEDSITKIKENSRLVELHKEIFNLDLNSNNIDKNLLDHVNFIKKMFYLIVEKCKKMFPDDEEDVPSSEDNKLNILSKNYREDVQDGKTKDMQISEQGDEDITTLTVKKYANNLLDRIRQMDQGEMILRFSQ